MAVAQPPCAACDVGANANAHAAMVRAASARVVVFPELSLTGYELDDAPLVSLDDPVWQTVVDACREERSLALVGAPVLDRGKSYIAMLAVDGTGVSLAYRKMWVAEDESKRFAPGGNPVALEVEGWRLGLAICKDTGIPEHHSATAALGIDCYLAGTVMFPDEAAAQAENGRRIATGLGAYVAIASFAGPTGSGYYQTAGRSGIWSPEGAELARTGPDEGELAMATLT